MVFFMVLIAGLGFVADLYVTGGGPGIVFYAVVIGAIAYVAIQYYSSGSQALSMAGARQIQKADNPRLYRIVENLAITTGLPMPNVYLVDDPAPNAFATGRDPEHAAVAATTGLLEIMDDAELEGVISNEPAKADDARRERLARAVREKGKDKVEGGKDDALCVICYGPPVDAVQVGGWMG